MTPHTIAQPRAALVFDQMAEDYDNVFTKSAIGRAQRDAVWDALRKTFRRGDHLLELNCGTGEDALFLAANGIAVTACDASQEMIHVASKRLHAESPDAPIQFRLLATEDISELRPGGFDGVFSNFSGLNCVADLRQTAGDLAALLQPNAQLLFCFSTRICVWEIIWYLLHGKPRKAFRRCSGQTTASVGKFTVDVHYPTIRQLKTLFSPHFALRSCKGVGVTVPPSYAESWIQRHPQLLDMLRAFDGVLRGVPGFRVIGDHMLLRFERVQE